MWWVAAAADRAGAPDGLTLYDLGIRRNTALDVERRWWAEARERLRDGEACGVLFSFGASLCQHRLLPFGPRLGRGGSGK
jgi:acyl-CoA thioesterase I